jgi:dTDP-4-dehydrorhamnose reductase
MKILITGANGFLGGELRRQLEQTKHVIIPFVRKKEGPDDIECDIGNTNNLLVALNEYQPDAVINCAAKVDFSENSKQDQYNINALAPAVIASWCVNNDAYLIHVSGSIVNDSTATEYSNASQELPINYYGKTKLLSDRAIRLSQCKYTIVRFGGIFGENGPNHLGINSMIEQAKLGYAPTIIGKGVALRNYIHLQDAAKTLIFCLDKKITGTHYSGSRESISIKQMIEAICDVYLDGQSPIYKDGKEAIDQITIVSPCLPVGSSFRSALEKYR